ncbi:MAG: hypothetical protein JW703_01620, partial [Candidatus Diapherotrites archaeon]|nr:hypothetical protein [Candidatus Diapherotrites archaeon]
MEKNNFKLILVIAIFLIIACALLIFIPLSGFQKGKIWTSQKVYTQGEYVKVFIELPKEKFDSCE